MPEELTGGQPENQPVAPEAAPETAPPRARRQPVDALTKLKKKYRLDEQVRLNAVGSDGRPMGLGPLMAPEVFDALSAVDPTGDKRYLDWMLYQAGGGSGALEEARKRWGIEVAPVAPAKLLQRFRAEVTVQRLGTTDVGRVVDTLKKRGITAPGLSSLTGSISDITGNNEPNGTKFAAMVGMLRQHPELRLDDSQVEKAASELLSYKLKSWVTGQKDVAGQQDVVVRDRVHLIYFWNKTLRGMTDQQAEAAWKDRSKEAMREYTFGDEDSLRSDFFGFSRHMPGKGNIYEKVIKVTREFIANRSMIERRNAKLEKYNEYVSTQNAGLPPDQQAQLRQVLPLSADVGKVLLTRDLTLVYKGPYPTVSDMEKANEGLADLPMRERVVGDVRFMGGTGKEGNAEKFYSDAYLDLFVPLTLAASIKAGRPSWEVSDPKQFDQALSGGTGRSGGDLTAWSRAHAGLEVYGGAGEENFTPYRSAVLIIHVKVPVPEPVRRVLMIVRVDDLVTGEKPRELIDAATFRVGDGQETTAQNVFRAWKEHLPSAVYFRLWRSFYEKAIPAVMRLGSTYHTMPIVRDPVAHYRERSEQGHKRFRESVQHRAAQLVDMLTQ